MNRKSYKQYYELSNNLEHFTDEEFTVEVQISNDDGKFTNKNISFIASKRIYNIHINKIVFSNGIMIDLKKVNDKKYTCIFVPINYGECVINAKNAFFDYNLKKNSNSSISFNIERPSFLGNTNREEQIKLNAKSQLESVIDQIKEVESEVYKIDTKGLGVLRESNKQVNIYKGKNVIGTKTYPYPPHGLSEADKYVKRDYGKEKAEKISPVDDSEEAIAYANAHNAGIDDYNKALKNEIEKFNKNIGKNRDTIEKQKKRLKDDVDEWGMVEDKDYILFNKSDSKPDKIVINDK